MFCSEHVVPVIMRFENFVFEINYLNFSKPSITTETTCSLQNILLWKQRYFFNFVQLFLCKLINIYLSIIQYDNYQPGGVAAYCQACNQGVHGVKTDLCRYPSKT